MHSRPVEAPSTASRDVRFSTRHRGREPMRRAPSTPPARPPLDLGGSAQRRQAAPVFERSRILAVKRGHRFEEGQSVREVFAHHQGHGSRPVPRLPEQPSLREDNLAQAVRVASGDPEAQKDATNDRIDGLDRIAGRQGPARVRQLRDEWKE